MQFKQGLVEDFPKLFGGGSESEQGQYSSEAVFTTEYGWYHSIYTLAGGAYTKFDEVESKPILGALRFLEYEKTRIELENKRIKKSMRLT